MDFDLSPEQDLFRSTVREFAEAELAVPARHADATGKFPLGAVKAMAAFGLFGLPFPEEWGGGGADMLTYVLALEEVGRVDSALAITLEAAVSLGARPIHYYGSEEQRSRWLPSLVSGEALGAFGLTEPDAGSDTKRLSTRATQADGGWVLDGQKAFITNSGTPITALVNIAARTGENEFSTFIVPAGTPGLHVEPAYRKLGWHGSDTHGLVLDGCRVPADALLGQRGAGLRQFHRILDEGRVAIAALSVGLAQGALDASVAYASTRRAGGRVIGKYQGIAFKLADMEAQIQAARLLTYQAAWLVDRARPYRKHAAIAKLVASETAMSAAREACQVHGGYGFIEEFDVARFYRDAKVLEIGEGTSEIQRLLIARELGPFGGAT